MVRIYKIFLIIIFTLNLHAEETGKAIMDSNPEKGIMLSEVARKNIGFKTMILSDSGTHTIPSSSLVHSRDKVGVYQFKDNWLKFIPVKVVAKNNSSIGITSSELSSGSEVVVEGAALVRVSEMEAFAGEE